MLRASNRLRCNFKHVLKCCEVLSTTKGYLERVSHCHCCPRVAVHRCEVSPSTTKVQPHVLRKHTTVKGYIMRQQLRSIASYQGLSQCLTTGAHLIPYNLKESPTSSLKPSIVLDTDSCRPTSTMKPSSSRLLQTHFENEAE